jgi:hypothetical protein
MERLLLDANGLVSAADRRDPGLASMPCPYQTKDRLMLQAAVLTGAPPLRSGDVRRFGACSGQRLVGVLILSPVACLKASEHADDDHDDQR